MRLFTVMCIITCFGRESHAFLAVSLRMTWNIYVPTQLFRVSMFCSPCRVMGIAGVIQRQTKLHDNIKFQVELSVLESQSPG